MPSPLISVDEFRERFDISVDLDAKRILPHIGAASRRLRKWVGDTVYAQASNVANNNTSDQDLVTDLKNAEAHLTYHFAILGFNSPLSSKGVVATSMADEGKEIRKYLLPDDTAKLAGQYLELAREICEPYLLSNGEPSSSFAIVAGEEMTEASTRTNGGNCC